MDAAGSIGYDRLPVAQAESRPETSRLMTLFRNVRLKPSILTAFAVLTVPVFVTIIAVAKTVGVSQTSAAGGTDSAVAKSDW